MQRDVKLYHDLEKIPLEIKTDSTVGSEEGVVVWFYSAEEKEAGGLYLLFNTIVQYRLILCKSDVNSWTDLPKTLPSIPDKVLSITLTRSTEVRLKVHCNKEEVLNVLISDTTCGNSVWKTFWSRNVQKIQFQSHDTASDYYKPGEQSVIISVMKLH